MKALKIIGIIVGALIILIIAGLITVTMVINPNNYKPRIEKLAADHLHRTLTLKGDISWTLFPWLGVKVNQVALSNPEGFSTKTPFASIEEADVHVRLFPLITGNIEFGKIILKNASVNLHVKPSGQNNWSDFSSSPAPGKKEATPAPKSTSDNDSLKSLNVGSIEIDNANLHLLNQQINQDLTLSNVNLKASHLNFNDAFPIQLSFKFQQTKPALALEISLSGKTEIDFKHQQYGVRNLNLSAKIQKAFNYLKKTTLALTLKGNFYADLQKQIASAKNIQLGVANLIVKGNLSAKNILSAPTAKGSIELPTTDLRQVLNIFNLHFKAPSPDALQQFGANIKFNYSPTLIDVPTFDVTLDQSKLTGKLDYKNGTSPHLNFNLFCHKINLDHYLPMSFNVPPLPNMQAPARKRTAVKKIKPVSASNQLLKNLSLKGQIKFDQIILHKGIISNFLIKASGRDGKLNIDPIQANLYGGQLQSTVTLTIPNNTPIISATAALTNIDMSQLTKSPDGKSTLTGKLNFSTNVSTSGNTVQNWLSRLNGKGKFSISGGSLNGGDFMGVISQGAQMLTNPLSAGTAAIPKPKKDGKTAQFSSITGSYTITHGVLNNQDFLLSSKALTAKGAGQISFPNNTIDYRCSAVLGKDNVNALPIPFLVTGKLTKPSIQLDVPTLVQSIAKNQIKKQLFNTVVPGAGLVVEQATNLVSGLFGGKKKN